MAAVFYGQAQASEEDAHKICRLLGVAPESFAAKLTAFPDRGRSGPMPPVEPLIYRLYEIVQNYGYAYKAVLNEKFGDGIMSAIAFSTKVEKEVDDQGVAWVNISMRGKWYVLLACPRPVQALLRLRPRSTSSLVADLIAVDANVGANTTTGYRLPASSSSHFSPAA